MAKTEPKKDAAQTKKTEPAAQEKTTNPSVAKAAGGIFAKLKAGEPIDNKKVDEWQKKWLALPEHRTKYAHLKDVPNVMGEELFAMANDIINFCQREPGGQSHIFKSIKENFGSFLKNPAKYLQKKAEEGKNKVMEVKEIAVKKAEEAKKAVGNGSAAMSGLGGDILSKAKEGVESAKEKAGEAREKMEEKVAETKELAEKKVDETKKAAKKAKPAAEKAKKTENDKIKGH